MKINTLKYFSLVTLFCVSPHLEAQAWRANYQRLLSERKDTAALQYLWLQTARGTRPEEHMERAKLLELVGFPVLSIREWADAARAAPSNTDALEGFGQAVLKWDRLGSVSSVARAARDARVNTNRWPVSFRIAVALQSFRAGSITLARNLLPASNSISSIQDMEARRAAALHLAGMQWGLGQAAAALQTLQLAMGSASGSEYGILRLQASRLLYDMGRMTESLEQLLRLPRNSASWYPGVLVGAWAAYRVRDYNLALGQLLTLHSPYLDSKFAPETYILEAATLFQLCHYNSAQRSLTRLREKYRGVISAIQVFSRSHNTSDSRVNAVLNYAKGKAQAPAGVDAQAYALMMDALLQEDVVARTDRLLLQTSFESENFSKIFPNTNQALLKGMRDRYLAEMRYARIEAQRDGGLAINRRLRTMREDIETAFENASLVEVEINTKLRERLIDVKVPRSVAVDFEAEVRKGFEFWPFEGEFWRDEVGSYAFATSHVCGEQGL
jgi:tetratricopeptide (TPR) repeat protein